MRVSSPRPLSHRSQVPGVLTPRHPRPQIRGRGQGQVAGADPRAIRKQKRPTEIARQHFRQGPHRPLGQTWRSDSFAEARREGRAG